MLRRGLELLAMLKQELAKIDAEDIHQLQHAWELPHRVWIAEVVPRRTHMPARYNVCSRSLHFEKRSILMSLAVRYRHALRKVLLRCRLFI